ncbi:hypothetical protein G6F50_016715 [Rhizopus delemar]|uniref:Uncharacterized protein n=1 Tax=Rhizopus delemar TaxID=936053 RepID=A0A9P6XSQ7_9FUNG|nr:hypothetical protein G6F50_016715 [Rhizopus delemar]
MPAAGRAPACVRGPLGGECRGRRIPGATRPAAGRGVAAPRDRQARTLLPGLPGLHGAAPASGRAGR